MTDPCPECARWQAAATALNDDLAAALADIALHRKEGEKLLTDLAEARAASTAWCQFAMQQHDARVQTERMADLKVNAYRAEFEKAIDDGRLSYGKSAKQWLSQLRAIKLQVHAMVDKFIGNPSQGRLVAIPPDLHSLVLLVDMVWLPNDTVDTVIDMDADAVALPADRTRWCQRCDATVDAAHGQPMDMHPGLVDCKPELGPPPGIRGTR